MIGQRISKVALLTLLLLVASGGGTSWERGDRAALASGPATLPATMATATRAAGESRRVSSEVEAARGVFRRLGVGRPAAELDTAAIETLVAQLGSATWSERAAADRVLRQTPAALPLLRRGLGSDDPEMEIVTRARDIIAALTTENREVATELRRTIVTRREGIP